MIRSAPLVGVERQRRRDVGRPVGDDHGRGEVDAELAQALGQPRAVAVGHAAGQDLGARDDDAGAGAHVQVGRSLADSVRRPVRVIS